MKQTTGTNTEGGWAQPNLSIPGKLPGGGPSSLLQGSKSQRQKDGELTPGLNQRQHQGASSRGQTGVCTAPQLPLPVWGLEGKAGCSSGALPPKQQVYLTPLISLCPSSL